MLDLIEQSLVIWSQGDRLTGPARRGLRLPAAGTSAILIPVWFLLS
jgi:hypothetical protein